MTRPRGAALVLALAGTGVAAYLTLVHYTGLETTCGPSGGCERVQSSEWSELAGIPVALLGLLTYLGLLAALARDGEAGRLAAAALATVGAGFSAYLTYRSAVDVDALCPWCVSSALILLALTPLTVARYVRGGVYPT